MQLIYGGKTEKSLPCVKFSDSFSLNRHEKHFSKTQEWIKLIEEITIPYVLKRPWHVDLGEDIPGFLIVDVFFRSNDRYCYQNAEKE